MADATRWVGLDVHATQTTIAVLDQGTGEVSRAKLRGSAEKVVPGFMAGLAGRVIGVYEAGPTGMGLARTARAMGLDLRVCAPGLIPRKPADRIKTDARDAERLVRQLAAGGLSFVRIPTEQEEALRDLVRAREDVRQDLMRARHRLDASAASGAPVPRQRPAADPRSWGERVPAYQADHDSRATWFPGRRTPTAPSPTNHNNNRGPATGPTERHMRP